MGESVERCPWCGSDPDYVAYHDTEWGVPQWDERILFELLVLEGAQAGLSWLTVLRKRARYREVYQGFDPVRVADFDDGRQAQLLRDPGIIRNRLKIAAARDNARAFLAVQAEFGRFADYLWAFVDGYPIQNRWERMDQVPPRTEVSDRLSRDLKRRGFRFVGTTICYAYMQAVGLVNDHLVGCHRYPIIAVNTA